MSGDVNAFLEDVLPRMRSADTALHNGDATERIAMWSQRDPVTLFGAVFTATRWDEINHAFDMLGTKFSDCSSFDVEVLAADVAGDLGYIVAIERTTASVDEHQPTSYALRVSTVFRREDGEWRVVHRHGDPYDGSAGIIAAQLGASSDAVDDARHLGPGASRGRRWSSSSQKRTGQAE